ncbi:MAG: histidine phosphatase family protein [Cyanobacteria bacterium P01_A01_bin.3]
MQWVKGNGNSQSHQTHNDPSQSLGWADATSQTVPQSWVDYRWLERRPANTTRVVFVRHGRSTYNDQQRFQGRSDQSVLTQQGWDTAHQTGQALRGVPFNAFYTSPLQRARQTAQAIDMEMARELNLSNCSQLVEVNLPLWEGKTYASVKSEQAKLYQKWITSPQSVSFSLNGNAWPPAQTSQRIRRLFPLQELYRQAFDFWHNVRSHHCGELLLAVAHGGSIRAAISTAIGLLPQHYHQLQQSNCGISIVDVIWKQDTLLGWLQGINQTGHLAEALPKLKHGKTGLRIIAIPSHSDRLDPLQTWLNDLPIQYCWIDSHPASRQLARHVCPHLAPVICNRQEDWCDRIHRAISQDGMASDGMALDKIAAGELATVAFVATPIHLATWLDSSLKLPSQSPLSASGFTPNTATILHVPSHDHLTIVQALNFIPLTHRSSRVDDTV